MNQHRVFLITWAFVLLMSTFCQTAHGYYYNSKMKKHFSNLGSNVLTNRVTKSQKGGPLNADFVNGPWARIGKRAPINNNDDVVEDPSSNFVLDDPYEDPYYKNLIIKDLISLLKYTGKPP